MATYAKGLPASVSAFAHAADQRPPEQQHSFNAARSAIPAHFRADASSSSHASSAALGEFGRFAQHAQSSSAPIGSGLDPREAVWERAYRSRLAVPPPPQAAIPAPNHHSAYAASDDGGAVLTLLSGVDSLVDAVDGDWERDLEQERQLERLHETPPPPLPADPLASNSCTRGHSASQSNPGDMSPTSQSLLSSVANLSLAEQTYLRTLLASQDPASMFEDYFSHATYTDDVWTPPPSYVREVLDRAAVDRDEGKGKERAADDEAGKAKAVRRLEMLLRHLEGQVTGRSSPSSSSTLASAPRQGQSWTNEMQHHHHAATATPRVDSGQSSSGVARQQDSSRHLKGQQHDYSTAMTYAPSSLSSSAFVSFAPAAPSVPAQQPHASPPIETQQHPSQRPAGPVRHGSYASSSGSAESHASDASYEEYAREKEARMRSNEGGRFGPDFTARAVAVDSPSNVPREAETRVNVTEGRTH
ncbi:hypothetical protein JCM3774_001505 [Rhodotorula dairenensis]